MVTPFTTASALIYLTDKPFIIGVDPTVVLPAATWIVTHKATTLYNLYTIGDG
jgi:hypothetical protein